MGNESYPWNTVRPRHRLPIRGSIFDLFNRPHGASTDQSTFISSDTGGDVADLSMEAVEEALEDKVRQGTVQVTDAGAESGSDVRRGGTLDDTAPVDLHQKGLKHHLELDDTQLPPPQTSQDVDKSCTQSTASIEASSAVIVPEEHLARSKTHDQGSTSPLDHTTAPLRSRLRGHAVSATDPSLWHGHSAPATSTPADKVGTLSPSSDPLRAPAKSHVTRCALYGSASTPKHSPVAMSLPKPAPDVPAGDGSPPFPKIVKSCDTTVRSSGLGKLPIASAGSKDPATAAKASTAVKTKPWQTLRSVRSVRSVQSVKSVKSVKSVRPIKAVESVIPLNSLPIKVVRRAANGADTAKALVAKPLKEKLDSKKAAPHQPKLVKQAEQAKQIRHVSRGTDTSLVKHKLQRKTSALQLGTVVRQKLAPSQAAQVVNKSVMPIPARPTAKQYSKLRSTQGDTKSFGMVASAHPAARNMGSGWKSMVSKGTTSIRKGMAPSSLAKAAFKKL